MRESPHLSVTWHDEETEAIGHLVVDRVLNGAASGGLRMRSGCTMAEIADLARAMSLKEELARTPGDRYPSFGGAKGGIDFDPADPRAEGVLQRFVQAVAPLVEQVWACGEDLGTSQAGIDGAVEAAGLQSCIQAVLPRIPDGPEAGLRRLEAALEVERDGLRLSESIGGYGVAASVLSALETQGKNPRDCTAVIQGFGSMGGATGLHLSRAGVRLTGIADSEGLVIDHNGLDVEHLLAHRTVDGRIDRQSLGNEIQTGDREDWVRVPADIAVPAAVSYAIDEKNQADLNVGLLVEAANTSICPDAERSLHERGVTIVPDIVANLGTNAWWWWTLFGDVQADADDAHTKVRSVIGRLTVDILRETTENGGTPRDAAERRAAAR